MEPEEIDSITFVFDNKQYDPTLLKLISEATGRGISCSFARFGPEDKYADISVSLQTMGIHLAQHPRFLIWHGYSPFKAFQFDSSADFFYVPSKLLMQNATKLAADPLRCFGGHGDLKVDYLMDLDVEQASIRRAHGLDERPILALAPTYSLDESVPQFCRELVDLISDVFNIVYLPHAITPEHEFPRGVIEPDEDSSRWHYLLAADVIVTMESGLGLELSKLGKVVRYFTLADHDGWAEPSSIGAQLELKPLVVHRLGPITREILIGAISNEQGDDSKLRRLSDAVLGNPNSLTVIKVLDEILLKAVQFSKEINERRKSRLHGEEICDFALSKGYLYFEDSRSSHVVDGLSCYFSPDTHFLFGPYIPLPPGFYSLQFVVRSEEVHRLRLEVVTGDRVLSGLSFLTTFSGSLDFVVSELLNDPLQFRFQEIDGSKGRVLISRLLLRRKY